MSQASKPIEEVLREEIADISIRRKVHKDPAQPAPINPHDPTAKEGESNGLTGLALSGGGVRSAAFCLGFVQGMYSAGRMKAFDFLSTVSGGGYAGALFSSEVAKQTSSVDWERNDDQAKKQYGNRLEIERDPDGSQSDKVAHLSMHGRMMTNLLRLFSRHLWGLLVNITFVLSGIIAIAAVLAYLGRLPWGSSAILYLRELKFNDDPLIPFFYAFIALLIWLLSHFVAYIAKLLNRRIPSITQYTYLLLIASVVLGFVSLLALGDVSLATVTTNQGLSASVQEDLNRFLGWVSVALGGLLAATLLPYFSPQRLVKSGQSDAGPIQRLIFNWAGKALLIGAPLAIFFFLVREDISGQTMGRENSDQLVVHHVRLLDRFVPELEAEAFSDDVARNHLARQLVESMYGTKLSKTNPTDEIQDNHDNVSKFLEMNELRKVDDGNYGFLESWMQWLADALAINEDFSGRVARNFQIRDQQAEVVEHLNVDCLSDPYLFLDLMREKRLQPTTSELGIYKVALELYGKISADLRAARGERPRETDEAENLLALLKLDSHTDKDSLLDAIKNLESATQQLEKSYGARASLGEASAAGQDQPAAGVEKLAAIAANPTVGPLSGTMGLLSSAIQSMMQDKPVPTKEPTPSQYVRAAMIQLAIAQVNGNSNDAGSGQDTNSQAARNGSRDAGTGKRKTNKTVTGVYLTALQQQLRDERSLEQNVEKGANQLLMLPRPERFHIENEDKYKFENARLKHANRVDKLAREVRENNWKLLQAMYPDYIEPQATTFAYVVNEADQRYRIKILVVSVLIFFAVGLLSNMNSTSLHGVYRDQLSEIWLADPNMPLSKLDTCRWGAPYHLINCTANRMGQRTDPDVEGKSRFILSHRFCGTKKIGYRETTLYQDGDTSLADAVAISGAAVTTITVPTFLHKLILFMTNFRLGQWLPNSQSYETDFYWPSPIRCFSNILWYPEQRSYLFISDGGHLDNTGLACLLERRCRFMVCVDGSHDPDYEFRDLLSVLHSARAKYGISARAVSTATGGEIQVTEWLKSITPDKETGISDRHFVVFKIDYPDRKYPGILIYSKLTVTDDEPLEIVEMARTDEHYPHDPTSNQFLDPAVFDAYLTLGRCIAEDIDRFVRDGCLDEFNLPLGWSSDRASTNRGGGDDGDLGQSADIPARPVSPEIDALLADLQAELTDRPFDRDGISAVTKTLQDWLESASKAAGKPDSSVVDLVSSWAKEKGLDASRTLRNEFCSNVSQLLKENIDFVRSNKEAADHFSVILSTLGGRSKPILDVLREMVSPDDHDRKAMDSSA